MIAFCQDKRRRDLVLRTPHLNGIDYLEVVGSPGCGNQLALTFLKDARGLGLTPENFVLTGDTVLPIASIKPATAADAFTVTVVLKSTGDFSPYTLMLVKGTIDSDPPSGMDPQLSSVSFSFKAGCPSPVDCLTKTCCPSDSVETPDIHYLARDYDGFRQAMLDRMAVLVPGWTERHAADPGITLVEALAYAADRISYEQDAVNTEAYIGTARSRISLRRHARLVDYQIQEGANARTWVCLAASKDGVLVPKETQFFPLIPGLDASVDPISYAAATLKASPGPVFESLESVQLFVEQNKMEFYTWGDGGCCLPVGATDATLRGAMNTLKAGQILLFEEAVGPLTGDPADADPSQRWAVRLSKATTTDHSGRPLSDPANPGVLLTNIAWQNADALPFPLCLSAVTDSDHGSMPISGVSVARGNVVAVDQGVWTLGETLEVVPTAPASAVSGEGCNCSAPSGARESRPRYMPQLAHFPLTFAANYDKTAAASTFLNPDPSAATPQISLTSDDGASWQPVSDLLEEDSAFHGFIPEIESDGTARLRFGDGTYGVAPQTGLVFTANYRTGNGAAGNVGRDTLAHVLYSGSGIAGVRNPIAAFGGADPETMEHIRQLAPYQFQSQMRCVTADDYGVMAAKLSSVRDARGELHWTGSWYTAFVSVDATSDWTKNVQTGIKTNLDKLRMMGTDLVVEKARFVGLRIGLEICVAPQYFRGDVYAAVWKVLVTGYVCNETKGMLDASNFQFGETVYVSPILAAAQGVVGVVSVRLAVFERMDSPTLAGASPPRQLTMDSIEIPRCDNDPNHADRGLLTLIMDGGK